MRKRQRTRMSKTQQSLQFPKIELTSHEPLQDYFIDDAGQWWSVARLVDAAKDLPVFDCPLVALELNWAIWKDCDIIEIANHCKRVIEADLEQPIILDWTGGIADGRHRVIRALIEGRTTIKAKRLMTRLEPCRRT